MTEDGVGSCVVKRGRVCRAGCNVMGNLAGTSSDGQLFVEASYRERGLLAVTGWTGCGDERTLVDAGRKSKASPPSSLAVDFVV